MFVNAVPKSIPTKYIKIDFRQLTLHIHLLRKNLSLLSQRSWLLV